MRFYAVWWSPIWSSVVMRREIFAWKIQEISGIIMGEEKITLRGLHFPKLIASTRFFNVPRNTPLEDTIILTRKEETA